MKTISCILILLIGSNITRDTKSLSLREYCNTNKCVKHITVDNIPTLAFQNPSRAKTFNFMTNSVFKDYTISLQYDNATEANNCDYGNIEFSKRYNPDINIPRLKERTNRFGFYRQDKIYLMTTAEIEFNDAETELTKVTKGSTEIQIGIGKKDFGHLFNVSGELCDTVSVSNDSEDSWFLFKNGKLDKIIIENYIH